MLLKKTTELTKKDVNEICELFQAVFLKTMSPTDFFIKFTKNAKGYSYHSILLNNENEIVGCYSSIPYEYNYFGNKLLFGLSVDTMIKEEYRGSLFTFKKMAQNVYEKMNKDGVSFVFGFPNDNVYQVRKKMLKWIDIGTLNYYILPLNIGSIKVKLKYFNFLSNFYASLVNSLVSEKILPYQSPVKIYKIGKKYNSDDGSEKIIKFNKGYAVYKIYNEMSVRTAYLIDVYPLEKYYLESFVKLLYKKEIDNIDIIIYVGKVPFKIRNLVKVPKILEPKTVHMSGLILNSKIVDERVFDLSFWEVNLSNYDVR